MNLEDATEIIIRPYITEKTFAMVENEQKICFLVKKDASKTMIQEAVQTLYQMVNLQECMLVFTLLNHIMNAHHLI